MNNNEQIIQKIVSVVNKTAPNSEVFLYGSRARGDANKLSDWDVLVLMKKKYWYGMNITAVPSPVKDIPLLPKALTRLPKKCSASRLALTRYIK